MKAILQIIFSFLLVLSTSQAFAGAWDCQVSFSGNAQISLVPLKSRQAVTVAGADQKTYQVTCNKHLDDKMKGVALTLNSCVVLGPTDYYTDDEGTKATPIKPADGQFYVINCTK